MGVTNDISAFVPTSLTELLSTENFEESSESSSSSDSSAVIEESS